MTPLERDLYAALDDIVEAYHLPAPLNDHEERMAVLRLRINAIAAARALCAREHTLRLP